MSGKKLALVFGWVFLIVGILGFFPNPIVGVEGFFYTTLNHNIVHLLSGIIFLIVGYSAPAKAALTLKVFGVVYLLITILGFLAVGETDLGMIFGLISINTYDNWLHLVLGVLALVAGIKAGKDAMPAMQTM